MKSGSVIIRLIAVVLLACSFPGCDGGPDTGGNPAPTANPTPTPTAVPTPQPTNSPGACHSPSLITPYVNDGTEVFYSYTSEGSTLDTSVFSDGVNVFIIVSDGGTIYGFQGAATGAGTSCLLVSAMADYDMNGVFDETAESFSSGCLRLDDGERFTYLEGRNSVEASEKFEESLLSLYNQVLFFNIYNPFVCAETRTASEQRIYDSLLQELKSIAGT